MEKRTWCGSPESSGQLKEGCFSHSSCWPLVEPSMFGDLLLGERFVLNAQAVGSLHSMSANGRLVEMERENKCPAGFIS